MPMGRHYTPPPRPVTAAAYLKASLVGHVFGSPARVAPAPRGAVRGAILMGPTECPLLAQSGHQADRGRMTAFDPKRMGWMAPAPGIRVPKLWKLSSNHEPKEPSAMQITTVGLDLAKNVFQVHAINSASEVVVKKTLRRSQMRRFFEQLDPCLVGIEACGTSPYW